MLFLKKKISHLFLLAISCIFACLTTDLYAKDDDYIKDNCKKALDFYLDRPDLETEFRRRFEYCRDTSKVISPKNYMANPIISDFRSSFGVNGRTRMHIHQGVDIIGHANEEVIAVADGVVLETAIENCVGPTLVVNHGTSSDEKKLITLYSHVGEFLVEEGDIVKRGDVIAKLPLKIEYPCMARVRHLHLQIGQQYCEKEEKNTWGCNFFIKDLYSSLDPNKYWLNKDNKLFCFDKTKSYEKGTLTYPFKCKKIR